MKLFLSWSGERSHKVAKFVGDWISGVIQQIEPWISDEMDRGSIWFSEIGTAINSVSDGIVFLTRENLTTPWILFEAGALARDFGVRRVCTFLIDLTPIDVSNPLAQFNHTVPTEESMFQLVRTLNRRLGDNKLSETRLEKYFNLHWPLFVDGFTNIMLETPASRESIPQKDEEEILGEVVESIQRLERRIQTVADIVRSPFGSRGLDSENSEKDTKTMRSEELLSDFVPTGHFVFPHDVGLNNVQE